MYTINISYRTGGSYHTEDTEDKIGCAWESKSLAREALKAIQEHYKIYKYRRFSYTTTEEEKREEAEKFPWYASEYPEYSLLLKVDDGTDIRISAFWIGYFEALYGAEIVNDDDEEDSFTV